MQKVITHEGAQHKTVDLCRRHGDADTIARYIGTDYQGVSHGLHRGECQECIGTATQPR